MYSGEEEDREEVDYREVEVGGFLGVGGFDFCGVGGVYFLVE